MIELAIDKSAAPQNEEEGKRAVPFSRLPCPVPELPLLLVSFARPLLRKKMPEAYSQDELLALARFLLRLKPWCEARLRRWASIWEISWNS